MCKPTCRIVGNALIAFGAAAVMSAGGAASARSLDFQATPVTDAVAQIDKIFNANIVIKPGVNVDSTVTFSVPNISGPGARIDAINDLANALGADFHKVFVVSRTADGSAPPDPSIDAADAPAVFSGGSSPASEAIETIAALDDATVQFYSPIHGTVTFSNDQVTAGEAARDVARQTHTVWKALYDLTPRRQGSTALLSGEKVIGYTAGGQPITELPLETFRTAVDLPVPVAPAPKTTGSAATASGTAADASTAQQQSAATAGAAGYNAQYPGYYYPQDAYGAVFNPYGGYGGYGGNGYNPYGGAGAAYGGLTVIGNGTVTNMVGSGGSPYGPYGQYSVPNVYQQSAW